MKKVLFIVHRLTPGGAEEMVVQQANRLNPHQFVVSLLTLAPEIDDHNNLRLQLQLPADKIKTIVFAQWYSLKSWKQLLDWLQEERFDVVYCHLWLASFIGRVAAIFSRIPRRIIVEHNVYMNRSWWERKINWFLGKFFTSQVVAVSQSVKDYLVTKEGILAEKIQVIYNGIDLKKFNSKSISTNARQELELADDDFVVLSLGKVSQQKGYDRLIATARILAQKAEGQKIHFVIAGRDETNRWSALSSGESNNVHFLGYRTDVPQLLSVCDVFFMPSVWEGFGLALVEAMAMGKPVVVSDLPTFHEILADSICGFFANTPEEFAQAILGLVSHKAQYEKSAAAGYLRAQEFSLEKNVQQVEQLFLS